MKTCRICQNDKLEEFFVKSKVFKSGYDTICLDCSRQKVKEWRLKGNRNCAAEAKRYYERYPEKGRAKAAKYRSSKRNAIPLWADIKQIEQIYLKCPEGFHVDHIIPLQGKLVCGLHVENNLQYLPSAENIRKHNKWQI